MTLSGDPVPVGLRPNIDQLTIETPEQTPLEFPLAGIGSRFLAVALDTVIQAVAFLAALVAAEIFFAFSLEFNRASITWEAALMVIFAFLLYYGYFAVFESLWNGQTPGKRKAGIRVIKDNGASITVGDAVSRNLLRLVDQLPGMYGVGLLTMMLNRQNKRLGDFVAGTVVVHEKAVEGMDAIWTRRDLRAADAGAGGIFGAVVGSAPLSSDEFLLVETFLDRRNSLGAGVRAHMAKQIADRVGKSLGVPPEERRTPEVFLETVARERRG